MDWNIEITTAFIEDYRNSPALWNNKISSYKDIRAKNDLLNQLANKYDRTVPQVKKKIKNLRSAFHRERRKLQSKNSGSSPNKRGKWFAFELLSFLEDFDVPKSTSSTADSDEDFKQCFEGEEQEGSRDIQHAKVEVDESQKLNEVSNKRVTNSREKDTAPKKKTRKGVSPLDPEEEAQSILNNARQRDDCSTYGEYVGNELRNLAPRAQAIVKHMINNTLFEAAMGNYDD